MPLVAENGMDWMYANCSTTAQRGALDWMSPFHDAVKPVSKNCTTVASEMKPNAIVPLNPIIILEEEDRTLRESEM